MSVVCKERYGSDPVTRRYVRNENTGRITLVETSQRFDDVWLVFRDVFLPAGYPDSVSDDYLEYQIWDTIQAFCSSITGTLAAEAILRGYGVGNKEAALLGATITWMMKDGAGMLGKILFTWVQGTSLDCDAKRWRLFADILNDIAICLDIISPVFGDYFIVVICTSGLLKSLVGVSGGATRAALTQHQARRDNMADVSAKDGSQETLVNLAALICGLILMPVVSGKTGIIWALFFVFTSIHLFANYRAVRCVVMDTINQARLSILVDDWLTRAPSGLMSAGLSVQSTNYREPVLLPSRQKYKIKLGVSIKEIFARGVNLNQLRGMYYTEKYLLDLCTKKGEIQIILSNGSQPEDQLKACFHAELINWISERSLTQRLFSGDKDTLLLLIFNHVSTHFPEFLRAIKREGWLTDRMQLGPQEWRADWEAN